MKSNDIIDALNMLNNDIIEETDRVRTMRAKRKIAWYKPLALAACFALIFVLGLGVFTSKTGTQLPKLTVMQISNHAEGFEGVMAYDISEIANNNPWEDEKNFSSLPVYKNTFTYDRNSDNPLSTAGHTEKLRKLIIDTAKRFKADVSTLAFSDDAPNEEERKAYEDKFAVSGQKVPDGLFEPTMMIAENDEIRITTNVSMTAFVTFKKSVVLPDTYDLSDYFSCVKAAEYLKNKYKDMLAMKEPIIDVCGGDYNVYGERCSYSIRFFESDNDRQKEIINYSFFEVEFVFDDDAKLVGISIHKPDLSQKVGDYPVITAEKARELLLNGDYISDVLYDFPGEKYVSKTELIYQTDMREEFFMPYYKFYVELPTLQRENGIKTYGIYYVPAVDGEYIQK